ncbi:DNA polymerase III subunit alpha [Catellicoccus marimammalium]|uniref:DNA-directed DNA polymerase n=1 Tax=Catellicoccus marimammalium M35/04/3 TaxID=1234409 RepID=K8ZCC7_9ENTE|nr:DNA polymerase III subunit alpha [Catellicoccus marimammalium]EKU27692.1 DNA polymerase III alpha subunit [Catellicoccus marimammalium M35/04/3]
MIGSLQNFSSYSFLESPQSLERIIEVHKEYGYSAIALTDKDHLYGAYEWLKLAEKEKFTPLLGMTLTYIGMDEKEYELLFLAKNLTGLQQLFLLSEQRSQLGLVSLDQYASLKSEDYIVICPMVRGEFFSLLGQNQIDAIRQLHIYYEDIFGSLPFLGIAASQNENYEALHSFLEWNTWPIIACQSSTFFTEEDAELGVVLERMKQNHPYAKREMKESEFLWPKEKWIQFYRNQGWEEALENQKQFLSTHTLSYSVPKELFPTFPTLNGQKSEELLWAWCQEGKKRIPQWNQTYEERLYHEWKVITELHFSDYFLIIADVLTFCRAENIKTTPGRGSAAGSLVAYVLGITDIDPLVYHLLFERFLNKNRQGYPDIDLDFPDNRRNEVYQYMVQKYGYENVARIVTFNTFKAKQVIRDVAKACGNSLLEQNEWLERIRECEAKNRHHHWKLEEIYETSPYFRQYVNRSEKNKMIYRYACRLQDLPKNASVHAAGMIVTNRSLLTMIPTEALEEGVLCTQWPMKQLESLGFLKVDFLSLRNLTFLEKILSYLPSSFIVENIPLNDEKTYQAFARGWTEAIFQFESFGMKSLLQRFKPTSIEELSLVNALYRPGPSQFQNEIIARREGRKPYHIAPEFQAILQESYGLMIYQEQVMQVAQKYANYTLLEADHLRRVMSKKEEAAMKQEEIPFLEHAEKMGHSRENAKKIFDRIALFAGYGFNKSHAIAYSIFAYRLMYLKVHYPLAFYSAWLELNEGKSLDAIKEEWKFFQVHLLRPDINESIVENSLDKNGIRLGLSRIKGVSQNLAQKIVDTRKERGKYHSLEEVLSVIPEAQQVSVGEALIYSGALDDFHASRAQLIEELPSCITKMKYGIGLTLEEETITKEENFFYNALQEKKYLGMYLQSLPLTQAVDNLKRLQIQPLSQQKYELRFLAWIKEVKEIRTKKKEQMAMLTMEDVEGNTFQATIFTQEYLRYQHYIKEENILLVHGYWQVNQYGKKVILQKLWQYEDLLTALKGEKLYLRVNIKASLYPIYRLLQSNPGYLPVIIVPIDQNQGHLLPEIYWCNGNPDMIQDLQNNLGEENVKKQ